MASRPLSYTTDRRSASRGQVRDSPHLLSMAAAHLAGHWQIMPAVLFLSVAFVYPVGLLLSSSFTDATGALAVEHYVRLYDSAVVSRVLVITFKIAAWTTLFSVAAAYPVAYLLATAGRNTRNLLIILVLMPFWTSFLVRTFAWIVLLGRNGVVSELAALLGLESPSLLYNFTGVMIGMVHALMPLCVLTMLSVMEGIDTTLVRAASTLGARPAQAFLRVYLPLSLPGIAAGALLVFITALGFFITPALLGSERETVIVQLIIFQIKEMLNWGFAGSIAVLLLLVALVIFYVYDRLVGLSTLSGGAARLEQSARQNPIGWFGRQPAGWHRTGRRQPRRPLAPGRADMAAPARSSAALRRARAFLDRGASHHRLPGGASFFHHPGQLHRGPLPVVAAEGFSLQWYESVLANPAWTEAAMRSLVVALAAGGLGLLLGVPAAFYIVRRARYKTALIGFLVAPIIMPNIIIAVSLFYLFASIGLVGSMVGLAIGHTILAVPYVVVTVVAVLKNYDFRLDQAAYTLGANRWRTFRYVTLPIIRSGLVAAFMFAFVISFDELTIALFIAGGGNATLPRKMWDDALLQVSPSLAAVAAMVLVFMTAIILVSEYARRRGAQGR
jgi:putative spermidine/putrescine transport system permease protein